MVAAKRIQPDKPITLDASSTALKRTELSPFEPLTIPTNARRSSRNGLSTARIRGVSHRPHQTRSKSLVFFARICDHSSVITDVRFDIFPHRLNSTRTSLIADTGHLTLSKLVPCFRRAQTPLEKAPSSGPGGHWPLRPASGPRGAPAAYRPRSHAL